MAQFNRYERAVAGALEKFPRLRFAVKEVYKRGIYLVYKNRGSLYRLPQDAVLTTPYQWAGLGVPEVPFFFGYYDKSPWSADMDRFICHRASDAEIGVEVLDKNRRLAEPVGTSSAWNWQQGAMAQWLAGGKKGLVYNKVSGGLLGCQVLGPDLNDIGFIPWPIQAVAPDGKTALSLNYRRLAVMRPDYGYFVDVDNFRPDQALERDGLWMIDLSSGEARLIISLAQLAMFSPCEKLSVANAHKVNHCIFSPNGKRFVFLHRFFVGREKHSRLYVSDLNAGLKLLMSWKMVSHYHWKDDDHVVAWARTPELGNRYYLVNVNTGDIKVLGQDVFDVYGDGHCTFSTDGRWMLSDTYPDRAREQRLLLLDCQQTSRMEAGVFLLPWAFTGTERCDLHPRFSPDNRLISFDSAHTGVRRSYILDVGLIMENRP